MPKKKIAILGGGMGGLSTAYYLTSQPGWQDRFDITVYQLGWRLGGKCASSRGVNDRIEEHGIHGFLGAYFNALPMMAEVYEELGRAPGQPLATFEEAFIPSNFQILWEWRGGGLKAWPERAVRNDRSAKNASSYKGLQTSVQDIFDTLVAKAGEKDSQATPAEVALLKALRQGASAPVTAGPRHPLVALIKQARGPLKAAMSDFDRLPDKRRWATIATDFLTTLVLGALTDNVAVNGYDRLDDENWSDWLVRHGAQPETLRSPLAMLTPNICYQSPGGDTSCGAVMGAGCHLDWTLRSLAYLDSLFWSFSAGTGETVVAPIYQVLSKRGVKFEFFQKVEALHLDPVNRKRVESVKITVQATLKDPSVEYRPLIGVRGLPSWPDRPLYGQLNEGAELDAKKIDLESYWNGWPGAGKRTLKAGEDYDELVFAIALGAVPYLCKELTDESPAWSGMVEKLPALQTQAMQLWLSRDHYELGWSETLDTTLNETPFSATYLCPPNGNADFHELVKWESWPDDNKPKAIWYFCGLMPNEKPADFSDTGYPARARARVKAQCIQYLQTSIGTMLPKATVRANNPAGDPMGLDFNLLVDHRDGTPGALKATGVKRFDSQFCRANIDPTELYVTSPPGSADYRLEAWGSGFENLTLAGDWIYTGLNVGSFETAVISGKLASYALCGAPALDTIVGYPTIARPQLSPERPHVPPPAPAAPAAAV